MKLEIKEITKTYDGRKGPVTALAPITADVQDGEFVCLLGPSGCGKSTLLYMLAGLEDPTSGEILLDGEKVTGPGRDRGMVFQNYTLFPWLNVHENASFANNLETNITTLTIAESEERATRVQFLLNLMGLSKFKDAYPKELSGGMKQRVAIARTLVNRPKLVLMDEPFGALDSQTREEMQELLLLLSLHEKTTVVFVTHDVDEAIFLGSRILVFSKRPGKIITDVKVPFEKKIGPNMDFSIKMSPEFIKMKRELLDLLHGQADQTQDRNETLAQLLMAQDKDTAKAH